MKNTTLFLTGFIQKIPLICTILVGILFGIFHTNLAVNAETAQELARNQQIAGVATICTSVRTDSGVLLGALTDEKASMITNQCKKVFQYSADGKQVIKPTLPAGANFTQADQVKNIFTKEEGDILYVALSPVCSLIQSWSKDTARATELGVGETALKSANSVCTLSEEERKHANDPILASNGCGQLDVFCHLSKFFTWLSEGAVGFVAGLISMVAFLLASLLGLIVRVLGFLTNELLLVNPASNQYFPVARSVFGVFSNLTSLVVAFLFVKTGFDFIFNDKKTPDLSNFILTVAVIAIGVSFSLSIAAAIMALSYNIGYIFLQTLDPGSVNPFDTFVTTVDSGFKNEATQNLAQLQGFKNYFMVAGAAGPEIVGTLVGSATIQMLRVIILLFCIYLLLKFIVKFAIRAATMFFLLITAPIGFVFLLAKDMDSELRKYGEEWWKLLLNNALTYPLIVIGLGIGARLVVQVQAINAGEAITLRGVNLLDPSTYSIIIGPMIKIMLPAVIALAVLALLDDWMEKNLKSSMGGMVQKVMRGVGSGFTTATKIGRFGAATAGAGIGFGGKALSNQLSAMTYGVNPLSRVKANLASMGTFTKELKKGSEFRNALAALREKTDPDTGEKLTREQKKARLKTALDSIKNIKGRTSDAYKAHLQPMSDTRIGKWVDNNVIGLGTRLAATQRGRAMGLVGADLNNFVESEVGKIKTLRKEESKEGLVTTLGKAIEHGVGGSQTALSYYSSEGDRNLFNRFSPYRLKVGADGKMQMVVNENSETTLAAKALLAREKAMVDTKTDTLLRRGDLFAMVRGATTAKARAYADRTAMKNGIYTPNMRLGKQDLNSKDREMLGSVTDAAAAQITRNGEIAATNVLYGKGKDKSMATAPEMARKLSSIFEVGAYDLDNDEHAQQWAGSVEKKVKENKQDVQDFLNAYMDDPKKYDSDFRALGLDKLIQTYRGAQTIQNSFDSGDDFERFLDTVSVARGTFGYSDEDLAKIKADPNMIALAIRAESEKKKAGRSPSAVDPKAYDNLNVVRATRSAMDTTLPAQAAENAQKANQRGLYETTPGQERLAIDMGKMSAQTEFVPYNIEQLLAQGGSKWIRNLIGTAGGVDKLQKSYQNAKNARETAVAKNIAGGVVPRKVSSTAIKVMEKDGSLVTDPNTESLHPEVITEVLKSHGLKPKQQAINGKLTTVDYRLDENQLAFGDSPVIKNTEGLVKAELIDLVTNALHSGNTSEYVKSKFTKGGTKDADSHSIFIAQLSKLSAVSEKAGIAAKAIQQNQDDPKAWEALYRELQNAPDSIVSAAASRPDENETDIPGVGKKKLTLTNMVQRVIASKPETQALVLKVAGDLSNDPILWRKAHNKKVESYERVLKVYDQRQAQGLPINKDLKAQMEVEKAYDKMDSAKQAEFDKRQAEEALEARRRFVASRRNEAWEMGILKGDRKRQTRTQS